MKSSRFQTWIDEWTALWGNPRLADAVQIQISSRMRRSLGRCYPRAGIIRLNHRLLEQPELLREVLCHEVAHVAVEMLHGGAARPHGREWAQLISLAGYTPRARMPAKLLPAELRESVHPRVQYWHACGVCGASRAAFRPMRRWRCATCWGAGLGGRLRITSQPVQLEQPRE